MILKPPKLMPRTSWGSLDFTVRILFALVLFTPFLNRGKAFYDENHILILLSKSTEKDQANDGH